LKSFERIGLDTEKRDFLIGFFVLIAFIAGSYLLINQATPKEKSFTTYHTVLTRGYGVGTGSGIMLSDIRIGEVGKINLLNPGEINIELKIYDEFSNTITKDSQLIIEQAFNVRSLLKGPGFSLQQGISKDPLNKDSVIETIERETISTMIEKANNTFYDIVGSFDKNKTLNNLDKILVNTNTLVTTLADMDNAKEVMRKVNKILSSVDKSTEEVSKMVVTRMDSTTNNINNTSENVKKTVENLEKLTSELAKIDINTLNKTVDNIEKGTQSMDFKPIVNNISKMTNSLQDLTNTTKTHLDGAYIKLNNAEISLLEKTKKIDTILDQSNKTLKELQRLISIQNGQTIEIKASYELEEELYEQ